MTFNVGEQFGSSVTPHTTKHLVSQCLYTSSTKGRYRLDANIYLVRGEYKTEADWITCCIERIHNDADHAAEHEDDAEAGGVDPEGAGEANMGA